MLVGVEEPCQLWVCGPGLWCQQRLALYLAQFCIGQQLEGTVCDLLLDPAEQTCRRPLRRPGVPLVHVFMSNLLPSWRPTAATRPPTDCADQWLVVPRER